MANAGGPDGPRPTPPLTDDEVARLQPIPASKRPPAGSILAGTRTIFVSGPGRRPLPVAAEATRVGAAGGRAIWRVDLTLPAGVAPARWPLAMERVPAGLLRAAAPPSAELPGFCPPWASVTFQPRGLPRPAEPPLYVKGRRVRPLYIFNDRRKLVTSADYPWWCVGLVKNNRGQTGSGALIGDSIVLTAGHVVPWGDQNAWMTFSPGWNIPTVSFGEWPGIKAHGYEIPSSPQDFNQVAHDLALVQLNYPLGKTLGFFGAKVYSDDWDDHGYWTSMGYPGDFGGNPAFEDADTVEDADGEGDGLSLETEASLDHGNSGGPFWAWWSDSANPAPSQVPGPYIIGVVSAEGAEAEIPQDHDNFLAGGQALVNLVNWGRANLT
jgi:V8-like Glu-specific endopeptidase